jgi:hypothetical protein
MFKSSTATTSCVSPKRLLAERLLRSVAAGNGANEAPQFPSRSFVLRCVEVRRVPASPGPVVAGVLPGSFTSPEPRSSAFRGPDLKSVLSRSLAGARRVARSFVFQRLGERLVSLAERAAGPHVLLGPVARKPSMSALRSSVPAEPRFVRVGSRLH